MLAQNQSKVLVAGVVRNAGGQLRRSIDCLSSAVSGFESVWWLVVESDSSDDTVAQLDDLSRNLHNFRYISLGRLRDEHPLRTERIAFCRNWYLQELFSNPDYRDIDYLIVADLDGVNRLLTREALASCWTRRDWDVCTANQRGPYYDIWALRHPVWSPNDCWAQQRFLLSYDHGLYQSIRDAVHSRMLRIPEDGEWIEVESAFGGLGVYKRDSLRGVEYIGLDSQGREICEHIAFHAQIRQMGGNVLINPKLINAGYVEHTRHLRPLGQFCLRVRLAVRGMYHRYLRSG